MLGLPATSAWWEVDGIEPLARRDRVYSAATAPACPYGTSHVWLRAPGLHRAVAAYETAWVPNRPTRADGAKAFNSLACRRYFRGQQNDGGCLTPYWRMAEHLKPMPCGTIGVQSRAGEPCRFTIPIGLPDRSRTYVLDLRRVALIR